MSTPQQENNRKNLIVYSIFGVVLVVFLVYVYQAFFAGPSTPPPTAAVPVAVATQNAPARSSAANATQSGLGVAPGVAAQKMASTSSSLDPTLDESAMLRTESLVYTGTGRNIFSLTYVPPVVLPSKLPPPRPVVQTSQLPPQPSLPPPPPPINLKFFGTETRADGVKQAFLLQGEDVYLASQGDIVARKYKIVSILPTGIQVEDLTDHNRQTLPLLAN